MSPPQPGDLIGGRYEVRRHLGTGGMAQVWLGHDRVLDRSVAIKILSERYSADPDFVERFRREASAAAGLNHPNIVSVYDRGEADDSYYIVMEHLEGPDLKQVLRDSGPLPPGQAIDLCQQILGALGAAHRRDIVHRDVKPQNVLLSKGGLLKVTDFGIARAGAESEMTMAGSVIGTAQYLSPEQARGDDVTAASDCYSVGIVLYEMLTGQVPFDGEKPVAVAMRQVSEEPADPRSLRADLAPELAAVVMKALAKRPSDRYRTADEFARALEEVRPVGEGADAGATQVMTARTAPTRIQRRPAAPAPPPPPEERKSPAAAVVALGLIAVMLLGLGLFLLGDGLPGGGSNTVSVPDVAGQEQAAAEDEILAADLRLGDPSQETSADLPAGQVIRTQPPAGDEVDPEALIALVVSSGRELVQVPDVLTLSQEDAVSRVDMAGLEPRVVPQNDLAPPGEVFRQRPEGLTEAGRDTQVTIFVSEGPASVRVPALVNLSEADAIEQLAEDKLEADVVDQPSSDVEPGTVIDQNPQGGFTVNEGDRVELTVAREPEVLPVPEVVGLSRDDALDALNDFDPKVTGSANSDLPPNTIVAVDPPAGTELMTGERVNLTVSRGPGSEPPPDDDGEDEPPPELPDPDDVDPTQ